MGAPLGSYAAAVAATSGRPFGEEERMVLKSLLPGRMRSRIADPSELSAVAWDKGCTFAEGKWRKDPTLNLVRCTTRILAYNTHIGSVCR